MVASAFVAQIVALEERSVGGYRLERRLGRGGMGEVWLGRHPDSKGVAAVKMIKPGGFIDAEKRAIARLCHPNIVGLYGVGDDYLICQFVDGIDLARRLRSAIDPAGAVSITLQIASALAHAHAAGVIHRDVKPGNILLDSDGNAFLADFGAARVAGDPDEDLIVGTPAFMAPEQEAGRPSPTSDQYALARTLLVMLAGGHVPVDPAEALGALPATLPPAMREVITRATDRDPSRRFPSVVAFADALRAIDLGALAPAVPLAREVRDAAPFGWCRGARRTSAVGHDIMRADYLVSELPGGRALLDRFGYAEIGFAIFGRAARLGPITEPAAFARASEVIFLHHGVCGTREVWRHVAAACCRANGQAIVVAPDCFGFGETEFADPRGPTEEQMRPETQPRLALAILALLGCERVTTVLVGHCAGATALLAASESSLPPNVHRVAITPIFADENLRVRVELAMLLFAIRTLGRFGPTKRWLAHQYAFNAKTRTYPLEQKQRIEASFAGAPVALLSRMFSIYSRGARRPPPTIR
jgi:serine/threonine-protein kinase